MELDVLAFGEKLVAALPALREEAGRIAPEGETAQRLVRATMAKAWRKREIKRETDLRTWLGAILRHEHARAAAEPRTFGGAA